MIDAKKFRKVYQEQFRTNPLRPYVNVYASCVVCGEDHFVKELPARDGNVKWEEGDEMYVNGHKVYECIACAAREDPPRMLY